MSLHETIFRESKPRSGVALGGIGAGSFELRKDGIFRNWTIFNNLPQFGAAKPPVADDAVLYFVVRYQEQGKPPQFKLLQIDEGDNPAGIQLQFYTFRWISGVARIDYEASYPFTRLKFSDPEMPFVVEMEAFSPFIPHDVKNSALPGVYFDFTITSRTKKNVDVMLFMVAKHLPGYGVKERVYRSRVTPDADRLAVDLFCEGQETAHDTWGELCLASLAKDSTWFTGWSHRHTFYEPVLYLKRLPNKDQTDGQNTVDKATGQKRATYDNWSAVAYSTTLNARRRQFRHGFVYAWFFPNLYSDAKHGKELEVPVTSRRLEGHYYANFFDSAAAVARYMADNRADLRARTHAFRDQFYNSSLPACALDQVNSHFNTFATSAWLNKAGDFGIQEGMTVEQPWGPLATIDVSMYGSIMVAALFPELDAATWRVHKRIQFNNGDVAHGLDRNFGAGDTHEGVKSRLDLAPQFVIQSLRHYFLTGDRAYLDEFWPSVKKAVEYTLTQRDHDGDGMPEMEGAGSSYDNFPMFGPASYIISQWIAALQYAVTAAEIVGDTDAAECYRAALAKARAGYETKLWNGKYFVLYNDQGGKHGGHDDGCLADQMIGQWALHPCGLGDIADRCKLDRALRYIWQRNFHPGDGLFNCRWPGDKWLHPIPETCWYDQANTFWTGVELAFAGFLFYEGLAKEALQLVRTVDERHRRAGRYFDHQEWGGHYFRALSAWSIIGGALGLAIHGTAYTFAPKLPDKNLRLFFSYGAGTGHYERLTKGRAETIRLRVHTGTMKVSRLQLASRLPRVRAVAVPVPHRVEYRGGRVTITFDRELTITPATPLTLTLK